MLHGKYIMVGGMQMPPRVSTGDRDAVLRQIRWCAAVQSLVNCHCQLEENPVGNVEPMQYQCRGVATSLWAKTHHDHLAV